MSPDKQTPEKSTQAPKQHTPQTASQTPAFDSISQHGQQPLSMLVQRARVAPQTLTRHDVLQLQRNISNRAVTELLGRNKPVIQPKLMVGLANDQYEQEADRVAAQVMSAPATQGIVQKVESGAAASQYFFAMFSRCSAGRVSLR